MDFATSEKKRARGRLGRCVYVCCQLAHVMLAIAFLAGAVAEFVAESPYFDVLVHPSIVPGQDLYRNVSGQPLKSNFSRVMDLPVLGVFLFYVGVVVWLRGHGWWAWSATLSMFLLLTTFLCVNLRAGQLLDWRFFSDRVLGILLNVLAISFAYTLNLLAVLNATNWFPFRLQAKRVPVKRLFPRLLLLSWNFAVLMTILTLCQLVWFSRLYTSWVCVHSLSEVLLLCQFTVSVQCWPCLNAASCSGLDTCVASNMEPYHCLSPLHTASNGVESAFCVFNYNIGAFTFITVFAYVGGLYFFLRTTFNAAVKCLRVAVFIAGRKARQLCVHFLSPSSSSHQHLPLSLAGHYDDSSSEEEQQLQLTDDQPSDHDTPSNAHPLHYK